MAVPEESSKAEERRRAENETIFREANESIRAVVVNAPNPLPVVPFICECGETGCRMLVRMTLEDYAFVRESPRRFLVADGHEEAAPGPTAVLRRSADFVVIEKSGVAGGVAEEQAGEGAASG